MSETEKAIVDHLRNGAIRDAGLERTKLLPQQINVTRLDGGRRVLDVIERGAIIQRWELSAKQAAHLAGLLTPHNSAA